MTIRNVGLALAGAAALAACGGGESGGEGNAAAPANQAAAQAARNGNAAPSGEAAAAGGGEQMRLQPGEWEMSFETTDVAAPGMPEGTADMMKTAKQTVKVCVSEEQASKPDADLFQPSRGDGNCKRDGFSMTAGRIQGTMTCTGDGGSRTRVTMDGQYSSTAFDLKSRTEMAGEGVAMTLEMRSAGRRLGECPAGAKGAAGAGRTGTAKGG
jgi:hypothetical protein